MSTKTYKKGVATSLSKNFKSTEFDCHGSGCCAQTTIDEKLVYNLQKIRDRFGKAVNISSGYRCPIHNKNVGGASASRHVSGMAADIFVRGIAPAEVAKYAEFIGILGIGLYETDADGYFVHVDTRDYKSFWYGQAQKYRSTFGGTRPTIMFGSKGDAVRELQIELTAMGILKDVVDGKFGNNTRKAVLAFQKQRGLVADGIVGKKTWAALYGFMAYEVEINTAGLNVRAGAGTKYDVNKVVKQGERFVITYEKDGWGWLSTGEGWISLKYTKKV